MESYEIIWKKVLPEIEIKLSSITYSTYIKGLKPIDLVDKTLVLMTEAQLKADFITRDTLKSKILDAFQKAKTDVTDIEIFLVVGNRSIERYEEIQKTIAHFIIRKTKCIDFETFVEILNGKVTALINEWNRILCFCTVFGKC